MAIEAKRLICPEDPGGDWETFWHAGYLKILHESMEKPDDD